MDLSTHDQDQPVTPTVPTSTPAAEQPAGGWFGRRSFLRRGVVAGAVSAGVTIFSPRRKAVARPHGRGLLPGDAALLRFAAAIEIIETDIWQQYNEFGGIQDNEVPGGTGNAAYVNAITQLDGDMPQYIHDNTEDEITHELFLNAFLMAHGEAPANLEPFRLLPSSLADGAQQIRRITNIMQLTVDTTFWTRYRDPFHNPDLNPGFQFAPAVPGLLQGQFPGIPRTNADLLNDHHLQAIANTAGFHFASIEIGGTSLYPQLAQRATAPETLRILLSIGPVEAMHFQTWHDKAGNAPPVTDPTNGLTFPNLQGNGVELTQSNLIMPEPCPFISPDLPPCSVIRPTETRKAAAATVAYFTSMGVFRGQIPQFFQYLNRLAAAADAARRGFGDLDGD